MPVLVIVGGIEVESSPQEELFSYGYAHYIWLWFLLEDTRQSSQ
jgi:hypothetical protein